MKNKNQGTKEIRHGCYVRRNEGKTIKQISTWLNKKGIYVSDNTISKWISMEKADMGCYSPNSDTSRYGEAINYQMNKRKMFDSAKEGNKIKAIVSETVESSISRSITKDITRELTVTKKYPNFLMCEYDGKKVCVDMMSIVSI